MKTKYPIFRSRPITRSCSRQAATRSDRFAYNDRSELTAASLGLTPYSYAYDNIGNRETAEEAAQALTSYATNPLNQYAGITQGTEIPFLPEYDAAGNQTKLQTSTGIWAVIYDANNRPTSFTSEDGQSVISCNYDYMGRRFMKRVTLGGSTTLHQFYLYRGYLQIAALDLTQGQLPTLWFTHWDPTEPIATRPLSIRKNATWYTYGHDLTKNITELFKTDGTIATTYDYTPYGSVTATGTDQPFQWSSEVYDPELGMVYYNYRHYNPLDGRWIGRDPIAEERGLNLYLFIVNAPLFLFDRLGLMAAGSCWQWGAGDSRFHDYPPQIFTPMLAPTPSRGNCYRYACNDPAQEGGEPYASPAPSPQIGKDFDCKTIKQTILNRQAKEAINGECPKCYYKVNLVIKPHQGNNPSDYHWYRKDDDGTWSHKPGCTPVIPRIISPYFDSKLRGYTKDCGIFCIPQGGMNVD